MCRGCIGTNIKEGLHRRDMLMVSKLGIVIVSLLTAVPKRCRHAAPTGVGLCLQSSVIAIALLLAVVWLLPLGGRRVAQGEDTRFSVSSRFSADPSRVIDATGYRKTQIRTVRRRVQFMWHRQIQLTLASLVSCTSMLQLKCPGIPDDKKVQSIVALTKSQSHT